MTTTLKYTMKKIIPTLIFSLTMAGCSTLKITPEVRQQLNQTQQSIKQAPIAILANSCMLTNELGRDQILITPSYTSAEQFNKQLIEQLSQQGVQVSKIASPLICGFMPEEQYKKYDVKADKKAKRTATTTYPLLNSRDNSLTVEQQNAVLELYQFFAASDKISVYNQSNKKSPIPLPILKDETAQTIKSWSNSRYIFVTSVDGLDASFGNKLVMGTLSAGVGIATYNMGSTFITAYTPKEGQFYSLRLLDLEQKNTIWSSNGNLKGNVFSYDKHSISAENILYPLFEKQPK